MTGPAATRRIAAIRSADALLAIADEVLKAALAAGADHAEAFVREGRTVSLVLKGDIAYPSESHNVGISLRVAVGNRVGVAGSSGVHRVHGLVDAALRIARGAPERSTFQGFAAATPIRLPPSPVDDALVDPDPERLDACIEAAMAGLDSPRSTYRSVSLTSGHSRFAVANDEGLAAWDQGGRETLMVENRAGSADHAVTAWDAATALGPLDTHHDLTAMCQDVSRRSDGALGAAPFAGTIGEVVLKSAPAAQVFSRIAQAMSGALASSRQSPLSDALEQQVASPTFTLRDLPHGDGVRQRMRVDHEGVPTEPVTLIENGVAREYLWDALSAQAAGARPNGHGLRASGWGGGLGVAAINTTLSGGERTYDQLIAGVDRAVLIVDSMTGMFTANAATGDFSATAPYGFLVENGAITRPLPNLTIGGNVLKMASSIVAMTRSAEERRPGTFPAVHCGGVSCAA